MRANDASLRVMSTTSNYEMTSAPPAVPRWLSSVLGTDELSPVSGPVPAVGAKRPPHDTILRIYHEHHEALLRFATLVAPEDCQAEDLVQDAFVRLYRSWGKVESPIRAPSRPSCSTILPRSVLRNERGDSVISLSR